jgi:hypothetical protein
MPGMSKNEMKMAFKQVRMPSGVYQIRNTENGKLFIDSSMNLKTAWNSNKLQLDMGMHRNQSLQMEWDTYGGSKFTFEVLEEIQGDDNPAADFRNELKMLERIILDELEPYGEHGYNYCREIPRYDFQR